MHPKTLDRLISVTSPSSKNISPTKREIAPTIIKEYSKTIGNQPFKIIKFFAIVAF